MLQCSQTAYNGFNGEFARAPDLHGSVGEGGVIQLLSSLASTRGVRD
jgi:hypothetical protein